MKLIIDIPEDLYKWIRDDYGHNTEEVVYKAVVSGIPYEERPQGKWIPIKTRPGTDEEYEEFSQYGDCPREDFRVFECPLPDDEQKVLVTTRWGDICTDIWHRDIDCCYFEDNCDDDDVVAWMPLPEPYDSEVHDD